ncbi:serine hydrolase domain-containing protein [Ekhidna sp.]|uniref:serine hydrolase domain-containing protein n=1 Tax=Ekhidna sp. TaxID=2608089 RepID=UPI003BA9C26C
MKKTILILMMAWTTICHGQQKKLYGREAAYQHFNGVVLIQSDDSIRMAECYGTSDGQVPNELHTRFDIGSITKQFTAAAILHLVMDNKIKLHDFINSHLGEYRSERWRKVTIHQLLTHTSGIPSLYQTEQGLEVFFPESKEISLDELISRFTEAKLLFSPGEEFSYSNSGYILLATIIEQVSGLTHQDYMLEMFSKYELQETSFSRDSDSAFPFYGYRNDLLKKAPIYHYSWFKGAGGVYSTVGDLSKWVEIITSNEFLNEELRALFLKPHIPAGYGYGWQFDGEYIQHDGGNAGFISFLSFHPKTKDHIVVLTNRSFEDISMFGKSADYIRGLVTKSWSVINGEDVEVLPAVVQGALTTGSFIIDEISVEVSENDTSLWVSTSEMPPSRIVINTTLEANDQQSLKMVEIARFLEKGKYWSLAGHCDGEMKFVMYSGMMSIGMRMMKNQVGKMTNIIPYYVDESHGLLRMKGTERILDLIVYFDSEGLIQGIFEHGKYDGDKKMEMLAYPLGNNLYYLDGLPYGEKSAKLKILEGEIVFYQLDRSVSGRRQ